MAAALLSIAALSVTPPPYLSICLAGNLAPATPAEPAKRVTIDKREIVERTGDLVESERIASFVCGQQFNSSLNTILNFGSDLWDHCSSTCVQCFADPGNQSSLGVTLPETQVDPEDLVTVGPGTNNIKCPDIPASGALEILVRVVPGTVNDIQDVCPDTNITALNGQIVDTTAATTSNDGNYAYFVQACINQVESDGTTAGFTCQTIVADSVAREGEQTNDIQELTFLVEDERSEE